MGWFCRIHAFILIFRDGDALISILDIYTLKLHLGRIMRKPTFSIPTWSDTNPKHKPGCTAIEDGQRLGISDLGSRGIVLSM